jgi:cell wall-associated NlpC family hydrolase
VWVRSFAVMLCSLIVSTIGTAAAQANGTGGATVAEPSTGTSTTSVPTVHAPVTAKTPKITYKGPVYEKTATGEVVPFAVPTPVGTTAASTTTGTAASNTGGSVVAVDEPTEGLPTAIPAELMIGDGMTSATGPTLRPELLVPGSTARFVDGLAAAPEEAPAAVQQIIWAGNEVIGLPYVYGGGHNATFTSPGYDCSGTVSFALHGASLLTAPLDSGEFETWGAAGDGRWVTIFTNAGHAYMTVAGLRLDTSSADDPSNEQGPRWRPLRPSNGGFIVRHPVGL